MNHLFGMTMILGLVISSSYAGEQWTGFIYPDPNNDLVFFTKKYTSLSSCKRNSRKAIKALKKDPQLKVQYGDVNPSFACGLNCREPEVLQASEVDKLFGRKDVVPSPPGVDSCEQIEK